MQVRLILVPSIENSYFKSRGNIIVSFTIFGGWGLVLCSLLLWLLIDDGVGSP